jgi:hypothetical protein
VKIKSSILIAFLAIGCFAGCRVSEPNEADVLPNLSRISTEALNQRVEILCADRQKAVKKFYQYEGASLKQSLDFFCTARNLLLRVYDCYRELDFRRTRKDALYRKYKAYPDHHKKLKGANYYMLMLQTSKTLQNLMALDPKVLHDQAAAREASAAVPGPPTTDR